MTIVALASTAACQADGNGNHSVGEATLSGAGAGTAGDGGPATDGATNAPASTTAGADSTDDGTVFDLGQATDSDGDGPSVDECKVHEGRHDVLDCIDDAPPDSFDPVVEWEWTPLGADIRSGVIPLVANLTDDNGDSVIDLCDTPDVVVIAGPGNATAPDLGHLYVVDGGTGALKFTQDTDLAGYGSPALGDIDGDGIPEIVAITRAGGIVVFEETGVIKWEWTAGVVGTRSAVSIANVDNARAPEIIVERFVIDAGGNTVFESPDGWGWAYSTTFAIDLDGDSDLEIIFPRAAYHLDGSEYYYLAALPRDGMVQAADLDGDGLPEVLVTNENGFTIVEHDGTIQPGNQDLQPTGDGPAHADVWRRPAAIHDFDADGEAEFSLSSAAHYSVFEVAPVSVLWTTDVLDQGGIAGGTAFDFLGDGLADAMYADEHNLYVFDEVGAPLFEVPHSSSTYAEYPVVADIDNDGSAEILVVSNEGGAGGDHPTLQAIGHVDNLWIQARRIWNQHTYHVSNVREDGTIPTVEPHHWEQLNTFRTQAQIEGGTICQPAPG
ncbi:MAG: VCBS repeat-containing protein [Myxococcota bacterium]